VIGGADKIAANPAKRVRYGLWKCRECRKQFTCKVGTVFEHARVPLHKALQAAYPLCCSKKGISSNQLARSLEISLKAAWFLSHRVREAMRELHFADQLGGEGKSLRQMKAMLAAKSATSTGPSGMPIISAVSENKWYLLWLSVAARCVRYICRQRGPSSPRTQSPNRRGKDALNDGW
jgi:transposase-like protein